MLEGVKVLVEFVVVIDLVPVTTQAADQHDLAGSAAEIEVDEDVEVEADEVVVDENHLHQKMI